MLQSQAMLGELQQIQGKNLNLLQNFLRKREKQSTMSFTMFLLKLPVFNTHKETTLYHLHILYHLHVVDIPIPIQISMKDPRGQVQLANGATYMKDQVPSLHDPPCMTSMQGYMQG
jgi:hypothetical protein